MDARVNVPTAISLHSKQPQFVANLVRKAALWEEGVNPFLCAIKALISTHPTGSYSSLLGIEAGGG